MSSICIWTLAFVFLFSHSVHGGYTISEIKYDLFQYDQLMAFRKFEHRNLDENFFESDYTKAPRYYNATKCLDNLHEIRRNLKNHDKESMKCEFMFIFMFNFMFNFVQKQTKNWNLFFLLLIKSA